MHLAFATEAAELSAAYGDYGEKFYNSLESSAEKFLNYAKLHPDFFSLHETEFENLISTADPLGYGVSDDLGYMMENVRIELGYYDDPDENNALYGITEFHRDLSRTQNPPSKGFRAHSVTTPFCSITLA